MLVGSRFELIRAWHFLLEKLIIHKICIHLQELAETFRSHMYLIPTNNKNVFHLS